ncbi:MAG: elongation factor P maturation arginine rhamnosyltransferase EarP [Spirochaetota bacterium]
MTLDLLCRVVDNYGDIGLVYRLAKALSAAAPDAKLRLLVDDLAAFHALAPGIDADLPAQLFSGWTVLRWDSPRAAFASDPPRLVIECFASGRPEGFEEALFDPGRSDIRHIVNLEHLSAEGWVRDFHKLPSLTRSGRVKKHFFMPGFETGTGGLVLDPRFKEARSRSRDAFGRAVLRRELSLRLGIFPPTYGEAFALLAFSYEHDYARVVADLASWAVTVPAGQPSRPLLALVAPGRSASCFLGATETAGQPFPTLPLPFLAQEDWDKLLLSSDFLVVRGEESLARAVLSGRPFIWQAYLQAENHQLVKVRALLDLMRPHFPPACFEALERLSLAFNDRLADGPEAGGHEPLLPLLEVLPELEPGFASFSDSVFALGDLGAHLVTFIREIVYAPPSLTG